MGDTVGASAWWMTQGYGFYDGGMPLLDDVLYCMSYRTFFK